jgi:membrane protease YdiL (CAAX protease family)
VRYGKGVDLISTNRPIFCITPTVYQHANAKFAIVKKIIGYLRRYYSEDFNGKVFLGIFVFTGIGVWFNYFHPWLLETKMRLSWKPSLNLYFFLLFAVPYLGSFLIQSLFTKDYNLLKNRDFWLISIFAILIFTLRSTSHLYAQGVYTKFQDLPLALYWYKIGVSFFRMSIVLIPIFFLWYFRDRKEQPLYGFTLKNYDTRPYLVMLAVMIPLIAWASFQADFLSTYPRGGELPGLSLLNKADHKYFALYEFVYGIDFVFIEFFFRGFLILALARIAGPGVILPMASFYVFIHFGKPMGETISSFFGGTLLGIIAYYSRSIAGGIIVHMGIAWMMEAGALLSKIYK